MTLISYRTKWSRTRSSRPKLAVLAGCIQIDTIWQQCARFSLHSAPACSSSSCPESDEMDAENIKVGPHKQTKQNKNPQRACVCLLPKKKRATARKWSYCCHFNSFLTNRWQPKLCWLFRFSTGPFFVFLSFASQNDSFPPFSDVSSRFKENNSTKKNKTKRLGIFKKKLFQKKKLLSTHYAPHTSFCACLVTQFRCVSSFFRNLFIVSDE